MYVYPSINYQFKPICNKRDHCDCFKINYLLDCKYNTLQLFELVSKDYTIIIKMVRK